MQIDGVFVTEFSTEIPANIEFRTNVPAPKYDANDPVVSVHSAALNPADTLTAKGWLKLVSSLKPPYIPGLDFAGTLEEKAVYGRFNFPAQYGTLCSKLPITSKAYYTEIPEGISFPLAAALPTIGTTAYHAVYHMGLALTKDSRVLVIGASGGVGSLICMIAATFGSTIHGINSVPNNAYVESCGVTKSFDYNSPESLESVEKDAYDVVFDCVGGEEYFSFAERVLKKNATLITIVGPYKLGIEVTLGRVGFMIYDTIKRKLFGKVKYQLVAKLSKESFIGFDRMVREGKIDVKKIMLVEFPAAKAKNAFALADKKTTGKVVVNF